MHCQIGQAILKAKPDILHWLVVKSCSLASLQKYTLQLSTCVKRGNRTDYSKPKRSGVCALQLSTAVGARHPCSDPWLPTTERRLASAAVSVVFLSNNFAAPITPKTQAATRENDIPLSQISCQSTRLTIGNCILRPSTPWTTRLRPRRSTDPCHVAVPERALPRVMQS
jgi:hypothetical protein